MAASAKAEAINWDLVRALVLHPEHYPELQIVKTKRKRGTVRAVYTYEDRLVLKQYGAYPWARWWRKFWQREHDALERIQGLRVPETYGYVSVRNGSLRSVVYAREFVAGEALQDRCDPIAPEYIPAIARLMAQVHRQRVIANDYSLLNVRIAPNGEILFIDFHRAHVFNNENARYWIYLGKDLSQFYRVPCRRRLDLFEPFVSEYLAAMGGLSDRQRRLILRGCRFWCWVKRERGPRITV